MCVLRHVTEGCILPLKKKVQKNFSKINLILNFHYRNGDINLVLIYIYVR